MAALIDQGVMTFINNRPDMEVPLQPLSEELEKIARDRGVDYHHIPMSGGVTEGLIEASNTVFSECPRPIVAFCASGMRSSVLWAFANVEILGVDEIMKVLSEAGFNLEQIRAPLAQSLKK
jgi:sulfide:quinone oxidoreductase